MTDENYRLKLRDLIPFVGGRNYEKRNPQPDCLEGIVSYVRRHNRAMFTDSWSLATGMLLTLGGVAGLAILIGGLSK